MKRIIVFVGIVAAIAAGNAVAGKDIKGTGATKEQACWNYNRAANAHAYVNGSCWGKCDIEKVTQTSNGFSFTFNNPNEAGSCPKPKYNGGRGKSDEAWVKQNPPPPGIPNPYPPQDGQPSGSASYRFQSNVPGANLATLDVWNHSSKQVTFYCEISYKEGTNWKVHAQEQITLKPQSTFHREYHRFEPTSWRGPCRQG